MTEIFQFIESHGFNFKPELDGTFHEFNSGPQKKGWYVGLTLPSGKTTFTFGTWNGDKFTYRQKEIVPETKEERALFKRLKKEQEKARLILWEKQSRIAVQEYKSGVMGVSPYLASKRIEVKTLLVPNTTTLMLPMHDVNGRLWNVQYIQADGFKSNIPMARVQGLFLSLGERPSVPFLLCEGYATAFTVNMALGSRFEVICCYGLQNVEHVIRELKDKYPTRLIALCLDNDWEKKKNSGLEVGVKLSHRYKVPVSWPQSLETGETDFSDFYVRSMAQQTEPLNPSLIFQQIESQILSQLGGQPMNTSLPTDSKPNQPETHLTDSPNPQHLETLETLPSPVLYMTDHVKPYVNGLLPMNLRRNKSGKAEIVEMEVAHYIAQYYKDVLIKYEKDIFEFMGTHWRLWDDSDHSHVIQQIMVATNGEITFRQGQNILNLFKELVPFTTHNMFQPNPFMVNFLNGTLHVTRSKNHGPYRLEFTKHQKKDFLLNVLPYDYDLDRSVRNEAFETMVREICAHDLEKIRAVKQMYGAAIAPIFPHFFLLVGKANSGKSSLIIPATKLVSFENISKVAPAIMGNNFALETMAGKLINVDTDIDFTKPLPDAVFKKFQDREMFYVDRKFKKPILAALPAVHLYAGNDIPPTLERGSGAHARRWTIIPLGDFQPPEGHDLYHFNSVFEQCPVGVLNFALEGLEDILNANGKYFVPRAGLKRMQAWQLDNDVIGSFIAEVQSQSGAQFQGGDGLVWDDSRLISSTDLWTKFKAWHLDATSKHPPFSKMKFFSNLDSRGVQRGVYQGTRGFRGFWYLKADEFKSVVKTRCTVQDSAPKVQNHLNFAPELST